MSYLFTDLPILLQLTRLLLPAAVLKTLGCIWSIPVLSHMILAKLVLRISSSWDVVNLVLGSSPFSYQNLGNVLTVYFGHLGPIIKPIAILQSLELVANDTFECWPNQSVRQSCLGCASDKQVNVVHIVIHAGELLHLFSRDGALSGVGEIRDGPHRTEIELR